MEQDVVRRMMWTGLVTVTGALASVLAHRVAAVVWQRLFKEEPPE